MDKENWQRKGRSKIVVSVFIFHVSRVWKLFSKSWKPLSLLYFSSKSVFLSVSWCVGNHVTGHVLFSWFKPSGNLRWMLLFCVKVFFSRARFFSFFINVLNTFFFSNADARLNITFTVHLNAYPKLMYHCYSSSLIPQRLIFWKGF